MALHKKLLLNKTNAANTELECDLCLDPPDNPRFLPCSHAFCLSCLLQEHGRCVGRGEHTVTRIRCPDCHTLSVLPRGGVRNLPDQIQTIHLGNLLRQDTPPQTSKLKSVITPEPPSVPGDRTPPVLVRRADRQPGTLAARLDELIRTDPDEAVQLLESLTETNRHRVLEEDAGILASAIREDAAHVLAYLLDQCGADLCQEMDVSLEPSGSDESVTSLCLLSVAALFGSLGSVKVLVARGADVLKASPDGMTPLYIAGEQGSLDVVRFLVESGVDLDATDDLGVSSLMGARQNPDVRDFLLASGADVHQTDSEGFTALHYAASEGCVTSVRLLARYGARLSHQNVHGNTPLHDASYKGRTDVARLLLSLGAEHSLTNKLGNTALHFAVHAGHKAIAQLLLNQGADPYVRNANREDCFLKAVLAGRDSLLGLLTSHHVDSFYSRTNDNNNNNNNL